MGFIKDLIAKYLPQILAAAQQKAVEEVQQPVAPVQVQIEAEPKSSVPPLTKDQLLMGRDKQYASEYTKEISDNLDKTLVILNKIQAAYGKPFKINSGWRPAAVNASTPGAAAHSKHQIGLAADVSCLDGHLWEWVLQNLHLMQELDIFMEDRRYTPTWVHFGVGKPLSGNRIFVPSANKAPAPDNWDGKYDHKYDQK